MKILAVADMESRYYYDYYTPGKLSEFDLILSCGDLNACYLEFLVTMASCPVFYVRGNHDEAYLNQPPEGCECLEDRIICWNGIRILGLGGAYRYRDGTNLYTERQMRWRIRRLWFQLQYHHGFDILLTHAPARHLHDLDTLPHRGFECFTNLLEQYSPKYFIHGHVHRNYAQNIPQRCQYHNTTVINAWESCAFDYES